MCVVPRCRICGAQFRETASKSLNDDHTRRIAWRPRRSNLLRDELVRLRRTAHQAAEPIIAKIQEKWMKLVKTSAIACALSALIVTPVLAQGTSSGARPGGTVQSKPMQGSTMGSGDEEMSAQPGAAGDTTGMKSTKGTRGTVGTTGSAAHKGTADDSTTGGAATGKRY
jgi:hypothetical protein